MAKHKKILWIVFAIIFVVALFFLKSKTTFQNTENNIINENGLVYQTETLENMISKDTDKDGIPDWQEVLYELDPNKQETTKGTPDKVAIENKKSLQSSSKQDGSSLTINDKNLSETEKFSRDLFTTIATLEQNGAIDQATIDTLSASLANRINNPVSRKVFTSKDIKITYKEDQQTIKKYDETLKGIYASYHSEKGVVGILEELIKDQENTNILEEFDPIISEINKVINKLLVMEVPQSISALHLELINNSQKLMENINDMKLFDSDTIIAMGAISKYWENVAILDSTVSRINETVSKKLNN